MNAHQELIIEKIIELFKANENEYDLEDAIAKFENTFEEQQFYMQQLITVYGLVGRKRGSRKYYLSEKGIVFNSFDQMRNGERLNKEQYLRNYNHFVSLSRQQEEGTLLRSLLDIDPVDPSDVPE